MGKIRKTISYLKRNGLLKTGYRILEEKKGYEENRNYADKRLESIVTKEELKRQSLEMQSKEWPLVSIIVPLYNTPEKFLKVMIESVISQSYMNWELILPDGSKDKSLYEIVKTYNDERIIYKKLLNNDGISGNTNAGIEIAKGDYIAFMDHDDFIEPDALYEIVKAFDKNVAFVYTDEDKTNSAGNAFFEPNYKPDFNYDLLLSNNYICHMVAVKKEVADIVKGLDSHYDGAQDFNFILRCVEIIAENSDSGYKGLHNCIKHVQKVLYHWRCSENSTADNPESKLYAYDAGKRAVYDHLSKRGVRVRVEHTEHLGFYRVIYEDIFERPEVGAVVFNPNGLKKYTENGGPFLKDENGKLYNPFSGLNIHYSGYMHRAKVQSDVYTAWRENAVIRPELLDVNMDKISDMGYLVVFDPLMEK